MRRLALGAVTAGVVAAPWLCGGVPPWSQGVLWLLVGAGTSAALLVAAGRRLRRGLGAWPWLWGGGFLAWAALQSVSVPLPWLARVAPEAARLHASVGPEVRTGSVSTCPYGTEVQFGRWLLFFAAAWVVASLARGRRPMVLLARALVFTGAGQALLGVLQGVGLLSGPFEVPGAVTGTFRNANHFAVFLAALCPLAVALWLAGPAARRRTVGYGGVLALLLAAILLSRSRVGWLAVVVAGLVWAGLSGRALGLRRRTVAALTVLLGMLGAGVFLAGALFFQAVDGGAVPPPGWRERALVYRSACRLLLTFGPLGCGLGSLATVWPRFHPAALPDRFVDHLPSDWLELLAETGWVGGFLLAGAFIHGGRFLGRALRGARDPARVLPALGAAAGLAALLAAGAVSCQVTRVTAQGLLGAALGGLAFGVCGRGQRPSRPLSRPLFARCVSAGVLALVVWATEGAIRRGLADVAFQQYVAATGEHPDPYFGLPLGEVRAGGRALARARQWDPASPRYAAAQAGHFFAACAEERVTSVTRWLAEAVPGAPEAELRAVARAVAAAQVLADVPADAPRPPVRAGLAAAERAVRGAPAQARYRLLRALMRREAGGRMEGILADLDWAQRLAPQDGFLQLQVAAAALDLARTGGAGRARGVALAALRRLFRVAPKEAAEAAAWLAEAALPEVLAAAAGAPPQTALAVAEGLVRTGRWGAAAEVLERARPPGPAARELGRRWVALLGRAYEVQGRWAERRRLAAAAAGRAEEAARWVACAARSLAGDPVARLAGLSPLTALSRAALAGPDPATWLRLRSLLDRAAPAGPRGAFTWKWIAGLAWEAAGAPERARRLWREAAGALPAPPGPDAHLPHVFLARLAERQGRTAAARRHWREVLRLAPGHLEAEEKLGGRPLAGFVRVGVAFADVVRLEAYRLSEVGRRLEVETVWVWEGHDVESFTVMCKAVVADEALGVAQAPLPPRSTWRPGCRFRLRFSLPAVPAALLCFRILPGLPTPGDRRPLHTDAGLPDLLVPALPTGSRP